MSVSSVQTWNAAHYAANGRFVATLAAGVVDLLVPQAGERVLDVGCGDGALTARLAESGALVRGVDASATMVAAARERGLTVDQADVTALAYDGAFDAVFSNAALHWIGRERQPAALRSIHRALRPGGRFVAEMGGQGNIAAIRVALAAVLERYGLDAEALAASFFPSPRHYQELLEQAGFRVETMDLIPRATPLPGGEEGMSKWLNTFRNGVLDYLPATEREEAVKATVALLRPVLYDSAGEAEAGWTADYVRLRFRVVRD
jgi:trans-aconitate methyltransferase